MNIVVTGAHGFLGSNFCATLKAMKHGQMYKTESSSHDSLTIYECDRDTPDSVLEKWLATADFVFHFAGVNRPLHLNEFKQGNCDYLSNIIRILEENNNTCPILLSSSSQVSRLDSSRENEYARSKLLAEQILRAHQKLTGASVYIYRLPNLYGKWCKPNYNSVVATFCYNISHGLPITIDNPSTLLNLAYIDDVISEFLNALWFEPSRCDYRMGKLCPNVEGEFCYVPCVDSISLHDLALMLCDFRDSRDKNLLISFPDNSLVKKMYSTYLSYLEPEEFSYKPHVNSDARGSFTELIKFSDCGQISVNVAHPGITKGQHWHHSKWEKFCVVSGEGLIQMRRIGVAPNGSKYPLIEFYVNGSVPTVVDMIPGYTHNITNLSADADLITLMWANENFDPSKPDTYFEEV